MSRTLAVSRRLLWSVVHPPSKASTRTTLTRIPASVRHESSTTEPERSQDTESVQREPESQDQRKTQDEASNAPAADFLTPEEKYWRDPELERELRPRYHKTMRKKINPENAKRLIIQQSQQIEKKEKQRQASNEGRAKIERMNYLMKLLGNNKEMIRELLEKEGILPKDFDRKFDRKMAWNRQRAELLRQAAEEKARDEAPLDDSDIIMVPPSMLRGKRLVPAPEGEEDSVPEKVEEQHDVHSQPSRADLKQMYQNTFRNRVREYSSFSGVFRSRLSLRSFSSRPFTRSKSTTTLSSTKPPWRPKTKPPTSSTTSPSAARSPHHEATSPNEPRELEPWRIQKASLTSKFPTGWLPRRKLSPDAMLHLRQLHESNPTLYTTPILANTFKVSPEAIRRILKSKWLSDSRPEEMQERRERWAKRHDRIWDTKSALGLRPQRRKERRVEDASEGGERVESEMWAKKVLEEGRRENRLMGEQ